MARETVFSDYWDKVSDDAESFINDRWDSIRQGAIDGDYTRRKSIMDDMHSELCEHLDQEIDLFEAADILSQCKNEETDRGIWDGHEDPEKAVGSKAFYSFVNDVYQEVKSQLDAKLEDLKDEQEAFLDDELQKELDKANTYVEELEEKMETALDVDDEEGYEELQKWIDKVSSLEEKISDQESVIDNIQTAIDTL